ncbi:response regulator transcription factor [Verrucosispora sioxanthis]|uniref:response regulator transcription factor n=1 Tax=Verrucosispora sioxanthis TaxID=2499994 RepID=UPI002E27BE5A|nr:helix-turn-helix transcriptional regulator [Verrucosispora sioxanthis]
MHRRSRRKRPAREALACRGGRVRRAGRDGVRRAGPGRGRQARRAAAAPSDLTATEERVARLAAQGRTSRAIADELFVSPKTVETNLSRVYRKPGISRRAELGAALARVGGADEQARGPAATASAPAGAVKG